MLRADLQARVERLRERINQNAVVQEGTKPAEKPSELLKEAFGLLQDLERLVVRINKTNLVGKISDGRSLTELLAERDCLKVRHALLVSISNNARRAPDLYSTREIRWIPQIDVASINKQADDVAARLRECNTRIQEADWMLVLAD